MEFHYFRLSPSAVLIIFASYLDTLQLCVGVEISYSLVYHMSKYPVYQARYRQLSGNYLKSHCSLLTLLLRYGQSNGSVGLYEA